MFAFIDVGSTLIKYAILDDNYTVVRRFFDARNYDVKASEQVRKIILHLREEYRIGLNECRICSSANGGLKIGIIALTKSFSGFITENLAFSSGANILFVDILGAQNKDRSPRAEVDILLIVGGLDSLAMCNYKCYLESLPLDWYRYNALIYAGNSRYFDIVKIKEPAAILVRNPFGNNLEVENNQLLFYLRNAYLNNLIDKDGIAGLQAFSAVPIWPTPAVVGLAFAFISRTQLTYRIPEPSIWIDIGGATTDVHFGLEAIKVHGEIKLVNYQGTNRYVFSEIGVYASRNSTLVSVRDNDMLTQFLVALYEQDAGKKHMELQDDVFEDDFLFYACLFLVLYRMSATNSHDVPQINFKKIRALIITGGASQKIQGDKALRILHLFKYDDVKLCFDVKYQFWIEGLKLMEGDNGGE